MWTGYSLFCRRAFEDFAAMRAALQEELGDLGPTSSLGKPKSKAGPSPAPPGAGTIPGQAATPAAPPTKKVDVDFDDF
jgi:hypothetical protein